MSPKLIFLTLFWLWLRFRLHRLPQLSTFGRWWRTNTLETHLVWRRHRRDGSEALWIRFSPWQALQTFCTACIPACIKLLIDSKPARLAAMFKVNLGYSLDYYLARLCVSGNSKHGVLSRCYKFLRMCTDPLRRNRRRLLGAAGCYCWCAFLFFFRTE